MRGQIIVADRLPDYELIANTPVEFTDPLGAVPDLPFGHLNAAWERFKRNLASNDEVWSFSEPCEVFGKKGVRNGYAILHKGEIGMFWVTDYRRVDEEAKH